MDIESKNESISEPGGTEAAGLNVSGNNNVDVSEARIQKEITEAGKDEGLDLSPVKDDSSDFSNASLETSPLPDVDIEAATQSLGTLLATAGFHGAGIFRPAWNLLQEEAAGLGHAWAKVIVKYTPLHWLRFIPNLSGSGDGSVCVECDAVLLTIKTIQPRLQGSEVPENNLGNNSEAGQVTEVKPKPVDPGAMKDYSEMQGRT